MRYEEVQKLGEGAFRRATGVKRGTFKQMLNIINNADSKKKQKGGRPNKLSPEDRVLMTLEYLREYRTLFHIGTSFGIAESTCQRNIIATEDILMKSGKFNLPRRKDILMSDDPIEVILVDASESTIERPKKKDKKP
jgi:hypothetical protein